MLIWSPNFKKKFYWNIDYNVVLITAVQQSVSLYTHTHTQASLVAQVVKNLSAMQKAQVWSLGWEDPLENGMSS